MEVLAEHPELQNALRAASKARRHGKNQGYRRSLGGERYRDFNSHVFLGEKQWKGDPSTPVLFR